MTRHSRWRRGVGLLPATGPPSPPQPLTGRDPSCEDAADTSQPSQAATQQVVPPQIQHTPRERQLPASSSNGIIAFLGPKFPQCSSKQTPYKNLQIIFICSCTKDQKCWHIKSIQLVPHPPAIITQPSDGLTRLLGDGVIVLDSATLDFHTIYC